VCVFWGVSLFMAKRNNFHFKRIYRPRLMLIPILLFLICHFGPLPSATSVMTKKLKMVPNTLTVERLIFISHRKVHFKLNKFIVFL